MFWNARGLSHDVTVALHNTFQFLASYDIVALTETKLEHTPRHLLPDHTLHTVSASTQHKAGQGLLLGVRTALNFSIQPWFPSCGGSGTAWIRITQRGSDEQFYIGSCYLPPATSAQLLTRPMERRLNALRREVSAAGAVGAVILGGDLNGRFGRSDDRQPQPHDEGLPPRGCSCGSSSCVCAADDRGRQLAALCADTGLALCTGRVPGDEHAPPSRAQGSDRPSRLDHILVSRHALRNICSCTVPQGEDMQRGSDHWPLLLRLRLFTSAGSVAGHISGRPLSRLAWDQRRKVGFAAALATPAAAAQLTASRTAAAAGDVGAASALLEAAVTAAALATGARRSCPASSRAGVRRPNHHAPFFDAECLAAHRRYWAARRTAADAVSFRAAELQFKSLVRSKRRRWFEQRQLQHVHDITHNARKPWTVFNYSRNTLPPSLGSPDQWVQFQQKLAAHQPPLGCHLLAELSPPSYSQEAADQLNAANVSPAEVLAALARLHNGRASGVSELPAEYRYAMAPADAGDAAPVHLLAPTLAALFSAAFAAGTIPDGWSTATITPTHKRGDTTDTANYRPVAVGVPLVRLYASVLNNRVAPYFEEEQLRAQAQAGFRARRSINNNLFALQHAIDRTRQRRRPLYCCFVDLTAAFDRVPRHLLWQRLQSRGVSGRMLLAIQALYRDARIVVKVNGHVGDSIATSSGVRQGCPLSPTLFGIYIDALEGWLREQAPTAGVPLNTSRGVARLLAALIYADDIALFDSEPAQLQHLLDSLAAFCTASGLDINLGKTKVMQFQPRRRGQQQPPLPHSFTLGAHTLENVDSYKYLGVLFRVSGKPADYMTAARHCLDHSYRRMRRQYCGMACGNNLHLQLRFFDALVTSSAMFGGELWGVHPNAAAARKQTASRYMKHLKALAGLPASAHTDSLLLELGWLSLSDRWLQCAVRFWNQLLKLPVDDLYRDVLIDSIAVRAGFAQGLRQACAAIGHDLDLEARPLRRLDCAAVMQLRRDQLERTMEAAADVDPRSCPSAGAIACKYWRWFRRSDMQRREQQQRRNSLFSLPASARKVNQLLRFRLGCLPQLAVVAGRHHGIAREQRFCRHCPCHIGDERHLIFECPAFAFLRHKFSHLFDNHSSVRSFMNQDSQKSVLHFICDCLAYDDLLANGVGGTAF